MTSYIRGLMADAGTKASYAAESEIVRTLAFGWWVLALAVLDVTRGY